MSEHKIMICRLCLKVIDNDEYEVIEGSRTQMFQDLNITDNAPVMCKSCAEEFQGSYDFKSTCLYTEDCINSFIENNGTVDMKEIYLKVKMDTKCVGENLYVCRLCMEVIHDENFTNVTVVDKNFILRDKLLKYFPEINLSVTCGTLICKSCFDSLEKHFNFMTICLDTEENIKSYLKIHKENGNNKLRLNSVYHFKLNSNTNDEDMSCSNEIKVELEEDFKTDLCTDKKIGNILYNSEPTDAERKHEIDETTEENGECATKLCVCKICDYSTKVKDLEKHMVKHKGKLKRFACDTCTFESDFVNVIKTHISTHKPLDEVTTYQCYRCAFKSRYKQSLKLHMVIHNPQRKIYKCDKCSYKTLSRQTSSVHALSHECPETAQGQTLTCTHCSYKSISKCALKAHLLTHQSTAQVKMYQCPKCPFQTKRKGGLSHHMVSHLNVEETEVFNMLSHKRLEEIPMYKCSECTYETKIKCSLKFHVLKHKSTSNAIMYECETCSYKTKYKYYLKHHMLIHNPENAKQYKCSQCDYMTIVKNNLKQHYWKHKNPNDIAMIKCESCSFETKNETNLKAHLKRAHKDPEALPTYTCQECQFETKLRSSLTRHIAKHNDSEIYKCDLCKFKTKYPRNLARHNLTKQHNLKTKVKI